MGLTPPEEQAGRGDRGLRSSSPRRPARAAGNGRARPVRAAKRAAKAMVAPLLHGYKASRAIVGARQASRRSRSANQVVFVSDLPRSREAKLAFGLRKNGWRPRILYRYAPDFDVGSYFDESLTYRDPLEAVILASRFAPVVYHVFAGSYFEVAGAMIRYRPGKIIFDDYDVFAGMMNEAYLKAQFPGQLEKEQYCLENADGLCCRSLETQYAKRRLGYRFRGKRLWLPDGCWGRAGTGVPVRRKADELHLVYCGNIPYTPQGGPIKSLERFVQRINDPGIHLHLHPSQLAWRAICGDGQMQALVARWANLHLHAPVPSDQVAAELSRYDAALFDASMFADAYRDCYADAKYVYATSNKLFDYLDGGLPIVISATRFQNHFVQHLGVGVVLDGTAQADLATFLRSLPWQTLRERAEHWKHLLAAERQARRLAAFYESVSRGA